MILTSSYSFLKLSAWGSRRPCSRALSLSIRNAYVVALTTWSLSGTYLYQMTGDIKYPDKVERMAYNALPAMLTPGKLDFVAEWGLFTNSRLQICGQDNTWCRIIRWAGLFESSSKTNLSFIDQLEGHEPVSFDESMWWSSLTLYLRNPFATDGSYSNVYGLEPNYPFVNPHTLSHPMDWSYILLLDAVLSITLKDVSLSFNFLLSSKTNSQ